MTPTYVSATPTPQWTSAANRDRARRTGKPIAPPIDMPVTSMRGTSLARVAASAYRAMTKHPDRPIGMDEARSLLDAYLFRADTVAFGGSTTSIHAPIAAAAARGLQSYADGLPRTGSIASHTLAAQIRDAILAG